jgi:CRP-like cAMP-binding protein
MAIQIDFLKRIPYFSGLSPTELDSIKKLTFEKNVDRGEMVVLDGEPAEAIYFVFAGIVKVFKTSTEGKEQILSIVRQGDSFNDVAVFDGGSNPASVQAMVPSVIYGITKNNLETILRGHTKVVLNTIKVLASRIRNLVSLVEDLSFRHVIGRVAKILLQYAGDGTGASPRLTQEEMAAMAGTVREVVGRSLKTLEGRGLIKLDRHRIVITNKEALKAMVEMPS